MFCEVNFKHVFYCVSWHKAVCVHIFCEIFPKRVISSQASFDLSQKPKSDIWDIVGGPRKSNEQSLPAYPFSHVQFPDNIKQRNLNIIKIINLTNLRILVIRPLDLIQKKNYKNMFDCKWIVLCICPIQKYL